MYDAVKLDCTKALELNPRYAKALIRRGRVLEKMGELEAALDDVTTACIFEAFSNQTTLSVADKILQQLGELYTRTFSIKYKILFIISCVIEINKKKYLIEIKIIFREETCSGKFSEQKVYNAK